MVPVRPEAVAKQDHDIYWDLLESCLWGALLHELRTRRVPLPRCALPMGTESGQPNSVIRFIMLHTIVISTT